MRAQALQTGRMTVNPKRFEGAHGAIYGSTSAGGNLCQSRLGMETVNRSAIVRPGRLNWRYRVDPNQCSMTLADLRREFAIYIGPECDSEEQVLHCLRQTISDVFEEQLNG